MDKLRKIKAIDSAVWAARSIIEDLDRDDDLQFATPEFREMFYELNTMGIKLSEMKHAEEEAKKNEADTE